HGVRIGIDFRGRALFARFFSFERGEMQRFGGQRIRSEYAAEPRFDAADLRGSAAATRRRIGHEFSAAHTRAVVRMAARPPAGKIEAEMRTRSGADEITHALSLAQVPQASSLLEGLALPLARKVGDATI